MLGSDMPHTERDSDRGFVVELQERSDLSSRFKTKLLEENAPRFYAR